MHILYHPFFLGSSLRSAISKDRIDNFHSQCTQIFMGFVDYDSFFVLFPPRKSFGGSLFFNVLNSASWCRSVVEKVLFIPEMFPDVLNEISSNFYRMEETSERRKRKKSTKHQLHILLYTVRNYGKVWLYLCTVHTAQTVHHIYILCYYSEQSLPQHNVNHFIMVVWWVPVHIGPWNGMV